MELSTRESSKLVEALITELTANRLISYQWYWKLGAFVGKTPKPLLPRVKPFIVATVGDRT